MPSGACEAFSIGSSSLLYFSGKQTVFTVGRFQVSPFNHAPAQPRPLHQVTPTRHSPPPASSQSAGPSESSESSTDESSITSLAVSPPALPLGYHGNHRGPQERRVNAEEEEGLERRLGQRLCERSAESSATSNHSSHQSWNLSAALISSEDSSSDAEEMWVELQELRER